MNQYVPTEIYRLGCREYCLTMNLLELPKGMNACLTRTQCHQVIVRDAEQSLVVSWKSPKRVIRALGNLLLASLCILYHLPTLLSFCTTHPCLRFCTPMNVYTCKYYMYIHRWQPLSDYSIRAEVEGRRERGSDQGRKGGKMECTLSYAKLWGLHGGARRD